MQRAVTASSQTERLGKYEIVRHIATGGMAEIHLARATGIEGFEKMVVLKRILPQFSTNQEFVQMFLDEARIAATLHHPNIVQVYDIGSVRGQYFFAMEFLQGEDVRRVMESVISAGREMPLEHAVNIILGVCNGLHYAHDKSGINGEPLNLVHRDVSPQNVFVTYDGGVKLVDFGIAKASNRLTETRQGTLKGKLSYMSPEQCRHDGIDRRSDVFALAIMLWELTTSKRLFRGPSEFEIMKQIIEADAPRPSAVRPGYSPDLERIVMKGLARDPDQRYSSVQEMQIDLEEFAREYKLAVSAISISRFMREMFGTKIAEWASAERAGHFSGEAHQQTRPAQPMAKAAPYTDDMPGLDENSLVSGVITEKREISHSDSLIIPRRSNARTFAISASVLVTAGLVGGAMWIGQATKHASSVEVVDTPSAGASEPMHVQAAAQLPKAAELPVAPVVKRVVAQASTPVAPPMAAVRERSTAPTRSHSRSEPVVERAIVAPTPRHIDKPASPAPKPEKPTSWDPNSAE